MNARKALNIIYETVRKRVLQRGNVRSLAATRVKRVGTLTYRLAIAQLCLVQVFRTRDYLTLSLLILTLVRTVHRLHITDM